MKKRIIVVLLLILFLPIFTNAESSNTLEIRSVKYVKTGDKFQLITSTYFKDVNNPVLNKSSSSFTTGLYMFAFQFEFDEDVLEITGSEGENNVWNTAVYKSDGKYYLLAELNLNSKNSLFCSNEISYCNAANVFVNFNIKDTDKTSSNIKIVHMEGALLTSDGVSELKDEDVKFVEQSLNVVHKLEITKGETSSQTTNSNPSIVEEKNINIGNEIKKETSETVSKQPTINNNSNKKTNTTTNTTTDNNTNNQQNEEDQSNKAYNNYLKTLEIEGYRIDFSKHQSFYTIYVPIEVKELKVNAVAESSKATVNITGADNLEENNNKIVIEVTAENKDVKKYIINVKRIEDKAEEKSSSFEITEDQLKTAGIFAGIVAGIGLIIFIIVRIRDRKIEKGMDKW